MLMLMVAERFQRLLKFFAISLSRLCVQDVEARPDYEEKRPKAVLLLTLLKYFVVDGFEERKHIFVHLASSVLGNC